MTESTPDAATTRAAAYPGGSSQDPYTGVVVIHGIGNEKRNETLTEALDALAYWLNQEAGLALRPEGPGRVWLDTELSVDQDPDAPASRAAIELAATAEYQARYGGPPALRMDVREVWWAQAFAPPSVGSALKWARVQWREEAGRVLLPFSRRTGAGPGHLAARAPARTTPQALHYRPDSGAAPAQEPSAGQPVAATQDGAAPDGAWMRRMLQPALRLYEAIQYAWKLAQWLVFTPVLSALLVLVSLTRLLGWIPLFRSAVLNSLNGAVASVSLHWVGPLQAYMTDYAVASSLRQRLQREVEAFLRDEGCERLVVIAHSMGTVIAYEGLATALEQAGARARRKPVTFVCLGQALRRMWLLGSVDPHRLRAALPEDVRWVNIWARYDPVAAGPLTLQALPRAVAWGDPERSDPYAAIARTLELSENVDVVNHDSLLLDHTTYWQNMEQVVGPIALELVAGHPALEATVRAHLANAEDILWRRWSVAWRAMLGLAAGLAIGAAVFVWQWQQHWSLGHALVTYFSSAAFLGLLSGLVGATCVVCQQVPVPTVPLPNLGGLLPDRNVVDVAAGGAVAIIAGVLAMPVTGWLAPLPVPSPARFWTEGGRATWTMFTLAVAPIALLALALPTGFLVQTAGAAWTTALFAELRFGMLVGALALAGSVVDTLTHRRWGWFLAVLLPGLLTTIFLLFAFLYLAYPPSNAPSKAAAAAQHTYQLLWSEMTGIHDLTYRFAATDILLVVGPVVVVGVFATLAQVARRRPLGGSLALVVFVPLVALFCSEVQLQAWFFGTVVPVSAADLSDLINVGPATAVVLLFYGLWTTHDRGPGARAGRVGSATTVALALVSLFLLFWDHSVQCSNVHGQCALGGAVALPAALGGLAALLALAPAVVALARRRSLADLVALAVVAALAWGGWAAYEAVAAGLGPATGSLGSPGVIYSGAWLAALAAALYAGLVMGPSVAGTQASASARVGAGAAMATAHSGSAPMGGARRPPADG
jgi:hypothetical protein